MAEVLLVIWTRWSRKPSDREISVSVSERANGKRQQENEKRAAVPGLRLEMELCKRIRSPAVTAFSFPASLRGWGTGGGLCLPAGRWFFPQLKV